MTYSPMASSARRYRELDGAGVLLAIRGLRRRGVALVRAWDGAPVKIWEAPLRALGIEGARCEACLG